MAVIEVVDFAARKTRRDAENEAALRERLAELGEDAGRLAVELEQGVIDQLQAAEAILLRSHVVVAGKYQIAPRDQLQALPLYLLRVRELVEHVA